MLLERNTFCRYPHLSTSHGEVFITTESVLHIVQCGKKLRLKLSWQVFLPLQILSCECTVRMDHIGEKETESSM